MTNEAGELLVFCPHIGDVRLGRVQRKEHRVVRDFGTDYFDGYAPLCPCAAGDHSLAPWGPARSIGEYAASATTAVYQFSTATDAVAAIEAWKRQQ